MLESIRQKIAPYMPSRRQVNALAAGVAFGIAARIALEATKSALNALNNVSETNQRSQTKPPPNSQKA